MKLTAKFRKKFGIPFSIETISGTQFRCGLCGKIFFSRNKLDEHLSHEKYVIGTPLKFPELDKNVVITVVYTQDIRDLTKPKYPKLKKGDRIFINDNKFEK